MKYFIENEDNVAEMAAHARPMIASRYEVPFERLKTLEAVGCNSKQLKTLEAVDCNSKQLILVAV